MGKKISTGFISEKINNISVNHGIACNPGNYTNNESRKIDYIVMHYSGNTKDTAKANCQYYQGADRHASAHLFVDDTNIYQSVELRDQAWHCGTYGTYYHDSCRNANSIGIEMCCTAGNYKISEVTKKNSAYLCAYLCDLVGITADQVDKYVVRHYDVTHKNCPAQMAGDSNKEWDEFKRTVKDILTGAASIKKTSDKVIAETPAKKIFNSYLVRVDIVNLNIRTGPGTNYKTTGMYTKKGVFTIVDEANGAGSKTGWGKLKSGAGWISLDFAKRI